MLRTCWPAPPRSPGFAPMPPPDSPPSRWLPAGTRPIRSRPSSFQRQHRLPKGVMLSHYNLIANIEAIAQLFWIGAEDRIVGVLPFFHSFGFNITIWFPLISGCGVVYPPNPTDAKIQNTK